MSILPASAHLEPSTDSLKAELHFDIGAFLEESGGTQSRLKLLRTALQDATTHLHELYKAGHPVRQLIEGRAFFVDQILHALWSSTPLVEESGVALLAVGGYGRGELMPHSDIDLLILMEDEVDFSSIAPALEAFVTSLWDLRLDIGHSVRTLSESLDQARQDITIATNLLETRTLAGPEHLRQTLTTLAYSNSSWSDKAFFTAKREEQEGRHKKYGGTDHNLEPNLKTSPGTLRDIQTIGWITKRHFGPIKSVPEQGSTNAPAVYDFLTDEELKTLKEGESFLWQLRYGLQMLAGRNENRLLFDYQRSLAALLGYHDSAEGLGVEQMMQKFYRYALALRELNDVILQHYEEAILLADTEDKVEPLNRRFQLRNDYIEAINRQVFAYQPFALIEIFLLMAQHPGIKGIRASTIRSLRAHRHLIDEKFRGDLANTSLFMEILRTPHDLSNTLSAMKRYGVLGNYLPEFGRIVGKMQHDLFHVYTVDVHTLQVIRNMTLLQENPSPEDYPLASKLVKRLPKIELLYIAGLYHDIAKGRGGDHSELGAVDVESFCKRHHLSERDTSLVAWLVKYHLLMSMTAQKKDPADPEVVHEFANAVGTQVHLDYLYVLTVSDISATNAKLWNNWRDALLRQLYTETKRAIRLGAERPPDRETWIQATKDEALGILLDDGFEVSQIRELWNNLDEDYFLQDSTSEIAWQTASILNHENKQDTLVEVRQAMDGDAEGFLQIMVYMPARPDHFALTTTALEQMNLNIHEARISDSTESWVLSNFVATPSDILFSQRLASQPEAVWELQRTLQALLTAESLSAELNKRIPRQLKHFAFPTEVLFSNDRYQQRTVVELITPDRPGLLARIAKIFLAHDINLVKARIATLGERVEDVFVITDAEGEALQDPARCQALQTDLKTQLDAQNNAAPL